MTGRLFHFSDDPHIAEFVPRPVAVPSQRPAGMEWLNGPLVWAVSEERQATYLLPRDCPRIHLWATARTTEADHERWLGTGNATMVTYVESAWLDRIRDGILHRYELPTEPFEDLEGGWTWVARQTVTPLRRDRLGDLPGEMAALGVELRIAPKLTHLRDLWSTTTLHVSGIRLRNADGWDSP